MAGRQTDITAKQKVDKTNERQADREGRTVDIQV